nr:reverse transcriptase domain-containing protein [Tanacetum cinerariifolium]
MLVKVGNITVPIEEDNKVPLILGRPFLHNVDAVIRVKQKQLNLGVGTERMTFSFDYAMKHFYSNDDTCFSIDVIDEILEEDFDALLDEGSKIFYSIKMALNNAQTKTNSSAFKSMLEKHQLTGPNFNECFRAIKLVVRIKKLHDVFETALPPTPAAGADA